MGGRGLNLAIIAFFSAVPLRRLQLTGKFILVNSTKEVVLPSLCIFSTLPRFTYRIGESGKIVGDQAWLAIA